MMEEARNYILALFSVLIAALTVYSLLRLTRNFTYKIKEPVLCARA